jgi:hypothetical protein
MGTIARKTLLAATAVVALLGFGPLARAAVVHFSFSGAGASGSGLLTITPDTVVGDPAGAYAITGASGIFSDSNIGVSGAAITGLTPINPVTPPVGAPAPVSLSLLFVTNPPPPDTAISYDNLFYPGGSPITCAGYPLAGGNLDVYGVLFTLSNGDQVDLWSDGEIPGAVPLTYGVAVVNAAATVVDYQSGGVSLSVPEPATWSLMLAGFGLAGLAVRRRNPGARATA